MNLHDFTDYCQTFYDKAISDALYPFATADEIGAAILAHVTDPNPLFPFDGDSMDREAVRDRILAMRKTTGEGETEFDLAVNVELIKRGAPESELIHTILPDGSLKAVLPDGGLKV